MVSLQFFTQSCADFHRGSVLGPLVFLLYTADVALIAQTPRRRPLVR